MAKVQRIDGADLAGKLLTALQFGDLAAAAHAVADAAVLLLQACETSKYRTALEENLELWVALKTLAETDRIASPELAGQIRRLASYVIGNTETIGEGGLADKTMMTLITIDLQVASGLVEAAGQSLVRQRAYEIWEAEGCPAGRDRDHWHRAERELYSA